MEGSSSAEAIVFTDVSSTEPSFGWHQAPGELFVNWYFFPILFGTVFMYMVSWSRALGGEKGWLKRFGGTNENGLFQLYIKVRIIFDSITLFFRHNILSIASFSFFSFVSPIQVLILPRFDYHNY